MKKTLMSLILVLTMILSMGAVASTEVATATFTDNDGVEVTVIQNPTRVAIYDYAILDMLQSIGFENTGIEQLIVPTKDTLPEELAFYKAMPDEKVIAGGSLFVVDWDVLDLVQPEVVILGGRSFGMKAGSDARLSAEDKAQLVADTQARYATTAFVKMGANASNSELLASMQKNTAMLARIFPAIADQLNAKLAEITTGMDEISAKAKESGKSALFCMMVDQTTLSVFSPNSRFDMLYEEFGFAPVDGEAVKWEDAHGFDVRAEYVLEKNPDVIFVLDRSATVGSGAGAENFLNDPIIAKTNAAANGDIYILSGNAWYTMTGGFSAAEAMISDVNQYFSK